MVKAFDSKSNGVSPHRFESCRLRVIFHLLQNGKDYHHAKFQINMLKNQIVIEELASNVFFFFLGFKFFRIKFKL